MKRLWVVGLSFGLLAGGLQGAPVIAANGIVNAASFKPVGAPGSALARGALASLFGAALGPAAGVSAAAFPLQTTLAGVSIRMTAGATTVNAIPVFVSAGQINFIVPSNTPLGAVQVTVTFNNETSPPVTVQVVAVSFGIFTRAGGAGQGIIQNFVSATETPLNTPSNSARLGQAMIAYGTGSGGISTPDNVAPPAADMNIQPLDVLVGGVPARRLYVGRSPCCAGLDQVVFELAANTPTGCYVPVIVRAGEFVSNAASIAVSASGGACTDANNPFARILTSGGNRRIGTVSLDRTSIRFTLPGLGAIESVQDSATALFFRADESFSNSNFTLPPLGACTVATIRVTDAELPVDRPLGLLDAGTPLRLTGPMGDRNIPRGTGNLYSAMLGGGLPLPGVTPPPLYLSRGRYAISAPGGADVGAFSASTDLPDPLTWTNRNLTMVNRGQSLPIAWTGGASGDFVQIVGASSDLRLQSGGVFFCTAPVSAGSFSVPAAILSSLPVSGTEQGVPTGFLSVGTTSYGSASTFTAPGLDAAILYYISSSGTLVEFR